MEEGARTEDADSIEKNQMSLVETHRKRPQKANRSSTTESRHPKKKSKRRPESSNSIRTDMTEENQSETDYSTLLNSQVTFESAANNKSSQTSLTHQSCSSKDCGPTAPLSQTKAKTTKPSEQEPSPSPSKSNESEDGVRFFSKL